MTSIEPLEVFIYKEGFARVSTNKFTLDKSKINDLFVHLTNYSIQKNNLDAKDKNQYDLDQSKDGDSKSKKQNSSPKITLTELKNILSPLPFAPIWS